MKSILDKDIITEGISTISPAVASRPSLPILSTFLLRAAGGKLHLVATDLDLAVSTTIPNCMIEEEGAACLPARRTSQVLNALNAGEIGCEIDKNHCLKIESGSSEFKINGLCDEEFPKIQQQITGENAHSTTIDQKALKQALNIVRNQMSKDSTRMVLNGVFFEFKKGNMTLVATDGRRLSKFTMASDLEGDARFILPVKSVNELTRLCGDSGTVTIQFNADAALFAFGEATTLWSKLVEGQFPNYHRVIPTECKERVVLNREEFLTSIRRVELFTTEKDISMKLSLTKNKLVITTQSADVGNAKEEIAVNYKGKEMSIAFNPAYVAEAIAPLAEDEVTLSLTDELSPGMFTAGQNFTAVVLPMRMS